MTPRATFFVGDFSDLVIKEYILGFLDCLFEVLSIFKTMKLLVFIEISSTIFVSQCLRMFEPDILNTDRNIMNDVLKDFNTLNA